MYSHEIINRKIYEARKYRGLSRDEMAELLKVHLNTYRRIETGETKIRADQLAQVAEIQKMDIRYYFMPDMMCEAADMKNTNTESLQEQIETIKRLVVINQKYNALYYFLESHTDIKELNTRLMHLESPIRQRVIDRMTGMIDGIISEFGDMSVEEEVTVPFSGIIVKENVISSVENFGDSIKIPMSYLKHPGSYFALKVADGSMHTEDIKKNSMLLFHISGRVRNGDIGLVNYNDAFLVKKLTKKQNSYVLTSCFKESDSMTVNKDKVKVCGIFEKVLSFNNKKALE